MTKPASLSIASLSVLAVLVTAVPAAGADDADQALSGASAPEATTSEATTQRTSPEATKQRTSPEHAPRRRDATLREVFTGPFPSSRLFSVPTAEVVGAYQLSFSGDASLLSESNGLSTSSVIALGFGDIAQLEYRSSTVVTTLGTSPVRLPTLGVQLVVPYHAPRFVPELAVALRFGVPRTESSLDGRIEHEENATDLYLVGRLPLGRLILHGGLRASQAEIASTGEPALENVDKVLLLPTAGVEIRVTRDTELAAELARVPLFDPGDASRPSRIDGGLFGRAGVRWRVLPWLVMDASVGYRIEVERASPSVSGMANSLVDWDMRLGGEIFVPWGAVLCRRSGVFCE